jgi:hypothetical protein
LDSRLVDVPHPDEAEAGAAPEELASGGVEDKAGDWLDVGGELLVHGVLARRPVHHAVYVIADGLEELGARLALAVATRLDALGPAAKPAWQRQAGPRGVARQVCSWPQVEGVQACRHEGDSSLPSLQSGRRSQVLRADG